MIIKEDHLTQKGPGLGFNQSFFKFQPVSKEISDFNQISNLAQKN